jgi:DNA-binding NtrC family response regulator
MAFLLIGTVVAFSMNVSVSTEIELHGSRRIFSITSHQRSKGRHTMQSRTQTNDRRLKDAVRAFEREYIMLRLKENRYDKRRTAEELHIALSSLYRKLSELHIEEGKDASSVEMASAQVN